MDDRTNTIAGWALFGGIVALGLSIATGMYFEPERPEKMGYVVEGVEEESAGPVEVEKPIAFYLQTANPTKGADIFKKCAACHTDSAGGPNGIGPNLYGVVGRPHAVEAGFTYSDALKSKPGKWDFDALSEWLKSPKAYAPGTKMSFAGLSKPQDRADVIAYLNTQGSNLPFPPPPAEDAAAAAGNEVAPADNEAAPAESAAGAAGADATPTKGTESGATSKQGATNN